MNEDERHLIYLKNGRFDSSTQRIRRNQERRKLFLLRTLNLFIHNGGRSEEKIYPITAYDDPDLKEQIFCEGNDRVRSRKK